MTSLKTFTVAAIAGASLICATAASAAEVTANQLLEDIRFSATLQDADLQGTIRKGRKKLPVSLFLRGEDIQFYFKDSKQKENRFHVRLSQDDLNLREIRGGKTFDFPRKKLGMPIDGTDLTYEDLSMRFLYWNTGVIEGTEKVGRFDCYKIRVVNPGNKGKYGIVYVWAHKKYHALVQVKGYTKAGKPIKQFRVTDIMKVGDSYTLETMRIDTLDEVSGRSLGVTYLDFDKPKNLRKRGPQ